MHVAQIEVNILGQACVLFVNPLGDSSVVLVKFSWAQWEVRQRVLKIVSTVLFTVYLSFRVLALSFFLSQLFIRDLFTRLIITGLHLHYMCPRYELVEQSVVAFVLYFICDGH